MNKVLFISHELSRTGAPMVLLHLARWLREHDSKLGMDLFTLSDGPMRETFAQAFDSIHGPKPVPVSGRLASLERKLRPMGERERMLKELSAMGHPLIYANTVLSIPAACQLKDMGASNTRVIAHVHEMNAIIAMYLPTFGEYVARVDHFIAVSQLVKDELMRYWGVPEERITVVYEFSEVGPASGGVEQPSSGLFEIGASGFVHWRKGHDLFIQLARQLKVSHPEVPARFTWVGRIDAQHRVIVDNDIARAGLTESVRFVGEQEDPMPWFRSFDAFVLPSREDPFPLVCIEVGMLGKPILCFQGATGIAEVLGDGGGYALPFLDLPGMADRLAGLWNDKALRISQGERARAVFSQFGPEDRCPAIGKLIKELLP